MTAKKSSEKKQEVSAPGHHARDLGPFALWDRMDEMFEDFKKDFFGNFPARFCSPQDPEDPLDARLITPPMDIVEEDAFYLITLELPGIPKDKVDINITKNMLEISASLEEYKEDSEKNYLHRERCYQGYQRRVGFQKEVNPDKAAAEFKDGVLIIKLPKRVEDTKKVRKLKIK